MIKDEGKIYISDIIEFKITLDFTKIIYLKITEISALEVFSD